jgi:hypothetical protein
MVGKRTVGRRGASRLAAAMVGAGALVSGTLMSVAVATPAGASSALAPASTSGTTGLSSIVSDLEGVVADLSLSNLGGYIEGHAQCPVSEVGYLIAGAVGPPPCAPGQIGG